MLTSLFKDLDTYKNSDLKQGQYFINYEQLIKAYTFKRLPFLQLTSMPGLSSINEAFNGDDSVTAKNKYLTDHLSKSEADFNKTLSEYYSLQQNLVSSALYHTPDADANKTIMAHLARLNDTLIRQAKTISSEISQLNVNDYTVKEHIQKQQARLDNYIRQLDLQRSKMDTVDGMGENTKLIRISSQYHYLMWFIILITLLSLFFYILTSDLVMNTLLVIICLMVIYLLARAISI
jgi:hypothetical protein